MKIICLWASPRNISTAFMYSFAQRKDTDVIDEPYYGYYLKQTSTIHPEKNLILKSVETNAEKITTSILNYSEKRKILFIKNMAHHIKGLDVTFTKKFYNVFLTRNPKMMIASFIKKIPNISIRDTGYKDQYDLLLLLLKLNKKPIVIDSKSLLINPQKTLTKLCKHLKIPFYNSMLTWEKGGIKEDGIWAKNWYENVHNSTEFSSYENKVKILPKEYNYLVDECNYYYNKLLKYSL